MRYASIFRGFCALVALVVAPVPGESQGMKDGRVIRADLSGQIRVLGTTARPGVQASALTGRVNLLAGGFRQLGSAGPMTPADAAVDRQMARDANSALMAIERTSPRDPGLDSALAGAYGALGDYQSRRDFSGYGFNPVYAYGGASRITRRMILSGGSDPRFERDLERYAMSMATWSLVNDRIWAGMNRSSAEGPDDVYDPGPAPPERAVLEPPEFDPATLTAAQKEAWEDLRPEFAAVSQRITRALHSLDELSMRLRAQRMDINPANLAASYRMQGFLEDAFGLIQQKDFQGGKQALERAAYECKRLRPVTGE
jgi:hypothetical protein